ncbi:MgtC/SapB family protein [Paenibacillus sp. NFR01]|uniref:MgtC/SapB family protein n=1 Tax=Paenibacillus sp. NFR01 TaxID=1566279 RepID=UPI0008CFB1A6|nr:MgtC/SapB family protein [Paenibacillus sp. NFR01]SET36056.1 putative Mg2+ transporter-C (MgtC) family protein [Paenibacillus sp. NFR01]
MILNFDMHTESILKLLVAMLLGLFIGIDRQLKQKPLGIRTSMVISIASCLVTLVSIHAYDKFGGSEHPNMDPMRLAAQIVSGIGFLGAGVILRRGGDAISGLTSAALIWTASGIGIAVGAGFYLEAAYAVVLLMFAVNAVPHLIRWFGPQVLNKHEISVKIIMQHGYVLGDLIGQITICHSPEAGRKRMVRTVRRLKIKDLDDGRQMIDMVLTTPERDYATEVYNDVKKIENVMSVEVEQL